MNLESIKSEFLRAYPYRIELHAHTSPVSSCSEVSPKELVETYHKLGYSAIAVTNHFLYREGLTGKSYVDWYLRDYQETKRYGEALGLQVYLGAEIRFQENANDYLIYGVNREMLEEIYEYLPLGVAAFRREYVMPNSVFIQAHPMRDGIQLIDPVLLDGVEVFNMHPNHNSRVSLASLYAKEHGISLITAGSDFHHPNIHHEGAAAIRGAQLPADTFDLAKFLRAGDYLLEVGRDRIVLP